MDFAEILILYEAYRTSPYLYTKIVMATPVAIFFFSLAYLLIDMLISLFKKKKKRGRRRKRIKATI